MQSLHGIRARALESVRLPGRKDTKQHSTRRHKQTNTQTNNTRRHNTTRADTTQHAQTQTNKQTKKRRRPSPPSRAASTHRVARSASPRDSPAVWPILGDLGPGVPGAAHTHTQHKSTARHARERKRGAGAGRGAPHAHVRMLPSNNHHQGCLRLTRTCASSIQPIVIVIVSIVGVAGRARGHRRARRPGRQGAGACARHHRRDLTE